MRCFNTPTRTFLVAFVTGIMVLMNVDAGLSAERLDLPPDVTSVLEHLLEQGSGRTDGDFDPRCLSPLINFILTTKPAGTFYQSRGRYDAPSAYHEFRVATDLSRLIDYSLSADIPSFFLWPSSLRLSQWTRVNGGSDQFSRLQEAAANLRAPFILKGTEHLTITPDQNTGAYYSYDVDKVVILTPCSTGMALVNIYRQQKPSEVGRKGWVIGEDEDWNYLYTLKTGLNIGGLGWARTYMYDSYGVNVYFQPDLERPEIVCGVVSWVKAGWAGINMVQPKHIHRGLVRVARAFTAILENPRLPDPAELARTFQESQHQPTETLKIYARHYFDGLKKRVASCEVLKKKLGGMIDVPSMVARMSREELYAVLAKDYFKKLLGHNPVIDSHPF